MDTRHFVSEKSKKLFDLKNAGPWNISKIINNKAYKLKISQHMENAGYTCHKPNPASFCTYLISDFG